VCVFTAGECRTALGMNSREIPDSAITASSSFDPLSVGPTSARFKRCTNHPFVLACLKKSPFIFFHNFWMQRTFHHWIATKWLEIDQENLHTKFSAIYVDFNSPSLDPLCLSKPAQAGVKDGYLPKKWLFCRYWLV